jgi:hypothetical protein
MRSIVRVTEVEPLDGCRLRLVFEDGTRGEIDLTDELWGPAFEPLRERALFEQVSVDQESGTIVWPNGADFAPEWLYEAISAQHAST